MSDVDAAVDAIRGGRLAIVPTDTVYGLAASAYSEGPVRRLYRAKGREEIQPTALVFDSVDMLLECVPELRGRVALIARALLPGPLTLVLPNPARRFRWLAGDRPDTIGVRVPVLDGKAHDLLSRLGAMVATSANLPGGPDPATIDEVPERDPRSRRRDRRRGSVAREAFNGDRLHRPGAGGPARGCRRDGRSAPARRVGALASSHPAAEEEQAWPSPRQRSTSFAPPASPTSIRKSLRSSARSSSGSVRRSS